MTYYEFKDLANTFEQLPPQQPLTNEEIVPINPQLHGEIVVNKKGQKVYKSSNKFEVERLRDWSMENQL